MTKWANMTQEQRDKRNAWKRARHAEKHALDVVYVEKRRQYARELAQQKFADDANREKRKVMAAAVDRKRRTTDEGYKSKKNATASKRYSIKAQDQEWVLAQRPINKDRMRARRSTVRLNQEYDAFLARLESGEASA